VVLAIALLWAALLFGAAFLIGIRPRPAGQKTPRWTWVAFCITILLMVVGAPLAAIHFSSDVKSKRGRGGQTLDAQELRGKDTFTQVCKNCHTLADAVAVKQIGPNLDVIRPSASLVINAVTNGRSRGRGQMPGGLVDAQGAKDVAAYLVAVAGR
jgi:mono/diheme cytochrome c family protein